MASKKASPKKRASGNKVPGAAPLPLAEQRRIQRLLAALDRLYPEATVALVHRDAFELLVATILSAQCTDERVNQVTPVLFSRFPDPAAMAAADPAELEEIIHSTGFFRNKAKAILGASRRIVEAFDGRVPDTMEDLLTLPGVARKTANVVLGSAFGVAAGVVVDTHVKRLAGRLGLTDAHDPVHIEKDLMARLPRARWISFSHQLIWHGRRVCKARRPACHECALAVDCPSAE